jgi:hypothetical protein
MKAALAALALHEETLLALSRGEPAAALETRPASGVWSARENLAHLGRYQEVLLERLDRIAAEEAPVLARYRTEEDRASGPWFALAPRPLAAAFTERRRALVTRLQALTAADAARSARHPLLGAMDVGGWLACFLDHEGHHLYVARLRLGQATARLAAKDA